MGEFCNGNFYVSHKYPNETINVLQPKQLVGCYIPILNPWAYEKFIILQFSMYFLLILIGISACRSMNSKSLDYYRMIGIYSIFTLAVPISFAISPYYRHPGFNKYVGFGTLIHNMAEFFLAIYTWFGAVHRTALPILIYVWVFTIFEIFGELRLVFVVVMLQGAFMDFLLCCTFYYIMRYGSNPQLKTKYLKKTNRRCFLCLGFCGAVLHVTSIIPLFIGFATLTNFGPITIVMLAPTFILYLWFVSADKMATQNFMRPVCADGGVYDKHDEILFKNDFQMLDVIGDRDIALNDMSANKIGDEKRNLVVDKENSKDDSNKRELSHHESVYDDQGSNSQFGSQFSLIMLVNKGLVNIDKENGKRNFLKSLLISFILDFVCCSLIFFSPCYLDVKPLVCNKFHK